MNGGSVLSKSFFSPIRKLVNPLVGKMVRLVSKVNIIAQLAGHVVKCEQLPDDVLRLIITKA